ncbi:MAG: hypothetical protein KF805_16260 [Phycisphaeraceae bacterium]|nr:hypothetical protein [Phycisphaeraceae bacterium]
MTSSTKQQLETTSANKSALLEHLVSSSTPDPEKFKQLVLQLETYEILVKVFVLEGTPFAFSDSPMRYIIFKEQVAERFNIGSQDVRIVGSARLGFSPSPHGGKYGKPFSETSDVDVVIVSEPLFHKGSRELFKSINDLGPQMHIVRKAIEGESRGEKPAVDLKDWKTTKEAVRNYVYQNFNPALLPNGCTLKQEIFSKIGSTAGIFLALQPRVFVSKIRCRIFRDWKAAEDYYTNSLRELGRYFRGDHEVADDEDEGAEVLSPSPQTTAGGKATTK